MKNRTISGSFEGAVKNLTFEIRGWIIGVLESHSRGLIAEVMAKELVRD
jgi:hypothetical protein